MYSEIPFHIHFLAIIVLTQFKIIKSKFHFPNDILGLFCTYVNTRSFGGWKIKPGGMNFLLVLLNCTNNIEQFPAVSGLLCRRTCHPHYPKSSSAGYMKLFIKAIQKQTIHCISPIRKAFIAADSGTALSLPLTKLEKNLENDASKQYTETQWKQELEQKRELQRTLGIPCGGQTDLYLPSERLSFIPERSDQQLKDIISVFRQAITSRSSGTEQPGSQNSSPSITHPYSPVFHPPSYPPVFLEPAALDGTNTEEKAHPPLCLSLAKASQRCSRHSSQPAEHHWPNA